MENWKKHLISFLTLSTFLFVALASSDDYEASDHPCYDDAIALIDPNEGPGSNGLVVNYQVKVVDQETNQPIPDLTVEVHVLGYHCEPLNNMDCPDKCVMIDDYDEEGYFIGLTNSAGIISKSTSPFKALDKKDRVKLIIRVKDENLLIYAFKRKDVIVGLNQSNILITIPLIKDDL